MQAQGERETVPNAGEANPGAGSGGPGPIPTASRRSFISRLGRWLGAISATIAAAAAGMFLVPASTRRSRRIALGMDADFRMRTVTWLRKQDLFVLRQEEGFGVFSARCTHLGCTVRRSSDGFVCPCHGARYDSLGRAISGPARRSLPWYRIRRGADGRLEADLAQEIECGRLDPLDPGAPGAKA
jgi:nitrite reductase/ring-hydroxylating ferredoxin subunit